MDKERLSEILGDTLDDMSELIQAAQKVVADPTPETVAELECVLNMLEDKVNQS